MSVALVKELRERTGLGMMECKKALAAVDGDIELAIEELRKSSGMKAAKKASRTAGARTARPMAKPWKASGSMASSNPNPAHAESEVFRYHTNTT